MQRYNWAPLMMILSALAAPTMAQESADRIKSGGTILTMNDKAMPAETVVEQGDKVVAVASKSVVTGTVAYRERIALPPSAVIKVQLVDVSRADAPAVVIGEQIFEAGGKQVPFAFEIAYDAAKIDERMSYVVQARIEDGGLLRFINDRHYPVITRSAPKNVDVLVRSLGMDTK